MADKIDFKVNAELYLSGRIFFVEEGSNPRIHLHTKDFNLGAVLINISQEQLAEEENRLYEQQQVYIRVKQNVETGAYDSRSAELIEFIDFEETGESPDSYRKS